MIFPSSGSFALTYYQDNPRLYYVGHNNGVHELAWHNGSWYHRELTEETAAPPARSSSPISAIFLDGELRVYYESLEHHIHELRWTGGGWQHSDLMVEAKATP